MLAFTLILSMFACTSDNACEAISRGQQPVASAAEIEADLRAVQGALYPELDGVQISLTTLESETDFFVSNLELATFEDPPLDRHYLVLYNPLLLDDPPPRDATVAILAHELKHVQDYTEMDSAELADFAIWYATADIADYEHETDEASLERGCGIGLIHYREWLYARISLEAATEKKRVYYTPEEIEAWMVD